MKSLFDKTTYEEIGLRLQQLTHDTKPLWGKMNVSQMLYHCTLPLENALGKIHQEKSGSFLLRLFKSFLYSDRPYRKNLPTAKHFIVKDEKDFTTEKTKLLQDIKEAHEKGITGNWGEHPAFGKFTNEQWGKVFYKHLDHHLRQFGV
ncbi:MAG: DUF1569 domain-containing protein [Chitinophagales bacterium]